MTINARLTTAGGLLADRVGESVTYHVSGGSDLSIKAVPFTDPPEPRRVDDGRSKGQAVTVMVAKSDVSAVQLGADRMTVPGAWMGTEAGKNSDGTVTLRVKGVLQGTQADADMWRLLLG